MTTHPFNQDLSQVDLRWLPRAVEHCRSVGVDPRAAETAAKHPDHTVIDPSSTLITGRWYAERRRKGDVTVIVGFPPGEAPVVWGVYYNLPLPPQQRLRSGGGGTTGRKFATTPREFRRRILEAGLVIRTTGGHDRIETPEGRFIYALAVSPSDHRWIKNATLDLARKGYDVTR